MATSIVKAVELDFAEFASTLISETLSAVISSILTQEKQVAELEQQTMLSPEEYARENLTDEIIRAEILKLFSSSDGKEDKSSVDPGEPYILNKEIAGKTVTLVGKEVIEAVREREKYAKDNKEQENKETDELPAIIKKVGYTITESDLDIISRETSLLTKYEREKYAITTDEQTLKTISRAVINETGYAHIYAAARLTLAVQHLVLIKQIIRRGIPRVYVNDGHIKSKLLLRFESPTSPVATSTTNSKILGAGVRKVVVQPVSANKPEYLTLNADILSEVELTFKTVIP
jgi:hypothetical protein